jgi:Tol biopolymer transport system component
LWNSKELPVDHERWRRVQGLFHAALGLEPEARQGFLGVACGGDIDLQREVELLLAREDKAASFLETPALGYATTAPPITPPLLGSRIGPYRIICLLGLGGMGEVYRAHDSKLDRDVAIKILPPEFARDPERLLRFRREARTLASLNHPNIAAIYGLEESREFRCLVLELVEGENLRGPLPVEKALDYARQVAEGLEAAHDRGIIHRDLKPANVRVTPQGRVKVLDFGLAKAVCGPAGEQNPSQENALTADDTLAGHILGTPGYMSPEQTRGQPVDERTDIWAFGCLLHELLTGKRAFRGESQQDTITAVLEREPDWQDLPAGTPPKIRELLRHCLQKEPDRRLSNIADARRTLEDVRRGQTRWRAVAIAIAVMAVVVAGSARWLRGPARPADRSQWIQLTKFPDSVAQPALSPDGRTLAFIRGNGTFMTGGQIYLKHLPDGDPVQLTHDDLLKMSPAFSPDGTRIAYTLLNSPWSWDTAVLPVEGGASQLFLRNASGLLWTAPREVLFSEIRTGAHMGLVTAEENRMGVRDVYMPADEPAMAHRSYLSPDHKWVLVVEMDVDHLWLPCRIVPADGSSEGHRVGPSGGCTFAAWSPDGLWMYFTANVGGVDHIWRQHFPDGQPEQITSGPTEEQGIAIAPDGRSLITAVALQNTSLWIHDAQGERQISLEGNAANPRFTPDGKELCYLVVKEAPNAWVFYRDPGELRVADIESGYSEPLVSGLKVLDYDLSRDGRQLVLWTADRGIWLAPFDRSSPPRRIAGVEGSHPRFGPDGDIFLRQEEGHSSFVYRVHPDGSGLKRASDQQVLILYDVLPDGRWVIGWGPLRGNGPPTHQAYGLDGGSPIPIGSGSWLTWSSDGRSTYIAGRWRFVIPRPPGDVLRQIPPEGFQSAEEIARLPGARPIETAINPVPGPVAGVYAFYRVTIQRNLYRIPIR